MTSQRLAAGRQRALAVVAVVAVAAVAAGTAAWVTLRSAGSPLQAEYPRHSGEAVVWMADDGPRVESGRGRMPAMTGGDNAIWSPGEAAKLFGLPGEVLAFQVVVTAGDEALRDVRVQMGALSGPTVLAPDRADLFVTYELPMTRRSGGKHPGASLGWSASATPPGPPSNGTLAEPLIPVERAPSWADYPMTVAPGAHRVVWIDLELPTDLPAGQYQGEILVSRGPSGAQTLGKVGIELEVGPTALPYRPIRTMVFFDPKEVEARVGSAKAVESAFKTLHAHHLSAVFPIRSAEDVHRFGDALGGSLYTAARGYRGPGSGVGMDVAVVGAYGVLGAPTAEKLDQVSAILEALAELGIEDDPGKLDVFLYAVDEQCDSPRGPTWRAALDAAPAPRLRRLRVGHTCSEPPAAQAVELAIVHAEAYDPAWVAPARARGKRVWIYNGALPRTGAFLSDSWPVSLRANSWIQAHHGIERWFYWESTFWEDANAGGRGPYDPWATAETFHNQHGDHANGDGVLMYPGRQSAERRDLGLDAVLPGIRLKQWRRGIQDAGYIALAARVDAEATDRIVSDLVGRAFEAEISPTFPTSAAPWTHARRRLFELLRAH